MFNDPAHRALAPSRTQQVARKAGTNYDAENPLTAELVARADIIFIFVMEKADRDELQGHFRAAFRGICSVYHQTPGEHSFMPSELVR